MKYDSSENYFEFLNLVIKERKMNRYQTKEKLKFYLKSIDII